jgi:MFS family permease
MMVVIGLSTILQIASSNTIVQTIVDDDKRGRVMSFYTMAFLGTLPLGNLVAGSLANHIGAPITLAIGGAFCILGSFWFAKQLPILRLFVQPIYQKIGLLPQAHSKTR